MTEGGLIPLADGWYQVKVPLPFSLKWVNSYLLPGEGGWTLIDPGLRTENTERFWCEKLAEAGIPYDGIRQLVLTHHHPDHYGMAGWFQARTGAPVWISQVAHDAANRLWGDGETFSEELTNAFLAHGLAPELADDILEHLRGFREKVAPQPQRVNFLAPGDHFRMGGRDWELIGGEGHAPGHLSFYDSDGGLLICGDQVLPDISPNIGWMPAGDPDPLGSFLDSLQHMLPLDVSLVFPGHRDPYVDFGGRVRELLAHHERRLNQMAQLIGEGGATAFELCERTFGVRLRSNPHQLRFALAETIAHVIRLERQGVVRRDEGNAGRGGLGIIRYCECRH